MYRMIKIIIKGGYMLSKIKDIFVAFEKWAFSFNSTTERDSKILDVILKDHKNFSYEDGCFRVSREYANKKNYKPIVIIGLNDK